MTTGMAPGDGCVGMARGVARGMAQGMVSADFVL